MIHVISNTPSVRGANIILQYEAIQQNIMDKFASVMDE